jgi:hypothetical protein
MQAASAVHSKRPIHIKKIGFVKAGQYHWLKNGYKTG